MRNVNRRTEIEPAFRVYPKSKDLLIRGGDFYAVWDDQLQKWSTDEGTVVGIVDKMLDEYVDKNNIPRDQVTIKYMWNGNTGTIDKWHHFVQKQCRDCYKPLDETLVFDNTEPSRDLYSSKKLPYALAPGKTDAWDKLIGTLYSEDEKRKIEWCIGSIVSGDSKKLQKFAVLYGSAGTGKSTVLNIIQKLFEGYFCVFVAKDLAASNKSFALEAFASNPLVAIEHDGDLSRIEDNTRLNSLISHEIMLVNSKFQKQYPASFKAFLFMGSNKPVKITDSKSGIIRRLIDIRPSGKQLPTKEYNQVIKLIDWELGAIADKCLNVYLNDKHLYDGYVPLAMMANTNDIFNFIQDSYDKIMTNGNSLSFTNAWNMWKEYTENYRISNAMPSRIFKEELKDYFIEFDGKIYKSLKTSKFKPTEIRFKDCTPAETSVDSLETLIDKIGLKQQKSLLDDILANDLAQYASTDENEAPKKKWDKVTTKLKDLNTNKTHYVNISNPQHIMIDLDRKKDGVKSLEENLKIAITLPPTYTEVSKGGAGLHMHYIYTGDVSDLSRLFDDNVEVKVFTGNSALRRRLTLCNDLPISTISGGLKKKERKKVVDTAILKSEQHLINVIKQNLRMEVHDNHAESIQLICKSLNTMYESGAHYSIPKELINDVYAFANEASNSSGKNRALLREVHWHSDDVNEDNEFVEGLEPVTSPIDDKKPMVIFDIEIFKNLFVIAYKIYHEDYVYALVNPSVEDVDNLCNMYRLVGFNNLGYDNHILYAARLGYSVKELYFLSYGIINDKNKKYGFPDAKNISYTDIYDFASAGNKMSLKKWEIKLGILHHENSIPWDEEVPDDKIQEIVEYCKDDVRASEIVFDHLESDFTARKILADLAGGTVNDRTNALTTKFIFGNNKNPQNEFYYRDLSKPVYESDMDPESISLLKEWFPEMMAKPHGEANSLLPYFPGYKFDGYKSVYRDKLASEGGYAKGYPGIYYNAALLDIVSMHPHSAMAEMLFGPRFTKAFHDIVYGRVHIKHEAWDIIDGYLDGKLRPYIQKVLNGEMTSGALADALKTAINSVYGLTAAKFPNAFKDPRNIDNIVAKRGSLFMIELEHELQSRGVTVIHIKTDSVKIAECTKEIVDFVTEFGARYGYYFEHEATYDKMCIVNDAVYIAKYASCEKCEKIYGYIPTKQKKAEGTWTATGTQFQVPYVFKTLFSHEEITFDDMCETFSVSKGCINLDFNENLVDIEPLENELKKLRTRKIKHYSEHTEEEWMKAERELLSAIETGHNYQFVGRVGLFTPVQSGVNGGVLYRNENNRYYAVSGTKGYRWMESIEVKTLGLEDKIDKTFYHKLVDDAVDTISQYGDIEQFTSDDPVHMPVVDECENKNCRECDHYTETNGLCDCDLLKEKINIFAEEHDLTVIPF